MIKAARAALAKRTRRGLAFDWLRLRARLKNRTLPKGELPTMLHLGCGSRRIPGFLNVDVVGSDFDVDLASGVLPWPDASFNAIVSQQVIEHLDLDSQLRPLLSEMARILRPSGEAWLACPDMEAICRSYLADGGTDLLKGRQRRWPNFSLGDLPASHMVNVLFHQDGEHVNLFDFALLKHLLTAAGFSDVIRVRERDLLQRFPEFPERDDDEVALYVRARR